MELCKIKNCGRDVHCRSLCTKHYHEWRRSADFIRFTPKPRTICTVEGCANPDKAGGLCNTHYQRKRRVGLYVPCLPGRTMHAYSYSGKCVHCGAIRLRKPVADPRTGWHRAAPVDLERNPG